METPEKLGGYASHKRALSLLTISDHIFTAGTDS
jgi:purine-nucleoside phosphorylase